MTDSEEQRDLNHLDIDECWVLVRRQDVGRLAVSIRNRPDIFPVNYAVDGESIVVNTAAGTKLAAAVLGRSVAFEVDALDMDSRRGWSVVVKGQAHEIDDLQSLMKAEDLGIDSWADTDKSRFLRIEVDEISGRRI